MELLRSRSDLEGLLADLAVGDVGIRAGLQLIQLLLLLGPSEARQAVQIELREH